MDETFWRTIIILALKFWTNYIQNTDSKSFLCFRINILRGSFFIIIELLTVTEPVLNSAGGRRGRRRLASEGPPAWREKERDVQVSFWLVETKFVVHLLYRDAQAIQKIWLGEKKKKK